MRTRNTILLLLCLVLTLSATARKKTPSKAVRPAVTLAPEDARRLSYFFLEGQKQKLQGNNTAAAELFQHCLDINPQSPEALYELGFVKFYLRQDSVGTEYIRRATEQAPSNPWYLETLASVYLNTQKFNSATEVLERLAQIQSNRTDVLSQLVQLYKQDGKTKEAISALNRIEILEGRNIQTSSEKFALYMDQGKRNQAFEELESLSKEFPYDILIKLQLSHKYMQYDDNERALHYLDEVRAVAPHDETLQMSMLAYYEATHNDSLGAALLDSLLYAPHISSDMRVRLIQMKMYVNRNSEQADSLTLAVLDSLHSLMPEDLSVARVRAAYLVEIKAPEVQITQALRQLLHLEPENETALRHLLFLYLRGQDFESLVDVCRQGTTAVPEQLMYHYYLGMGLYQLDRTEECVDAFLNALHQVDENSASDMVSNLWSILGDAYHALGKMQECYAAYDSCLVYMDDNASCLNNYAYFLTLEEKQLDKAEEMSYRSIKLEPSNKTYLDTYAWVLFVRGNYTDARHYIDMVIGPDATDENLMREEVHAEVVEHAGDIYAQCGLMEQALRYWNIAQSKGSEHAELLQKKIESKKYIKK